MHVALCSRQWTFWQSGVQYHTSLHRPQRRQCAESVSHWMHMRYRRRSSSSWRSSVAVAKEAREGKNEWVLKGLFLRAICIPAVVICMSLGMMRGLLYFAIIYATEDDLKAIDKEIKKIVNESADFAKESPEPALEELWTDIYATEVPQEAEA